ncbi:hypothetical protein ACLB1S_05870 [Escherichia coli]
MFERFLNPERVSMPDFDVDFYYGEVRSGYRARQRTCPVVMRYRRSSPSVQWRRKR